MGIAENNMENRGYIHREPLLGEYVAGGEKSLKYEVVNPTGIWDEYMPIGEKQKRAKWDSMSCVSYAILSSIEAQINYFISTGAISPHLVKDYLVQGEINFSDRFLSSMSETTQRGNYFTTVAETLRKHGAVSETEYPFDTSSWENFIKKPGLWTQDKALKFLDIFDIGYEFVYSDFEKHRKQAPLVLALPVCTPWDGYVQYCGGKRSGHAVLEKNGNNEIFDTYVPFNKRLSPDYHIGAYLKVIIKPKSMKLTQEQVVKLYSLVFKRSPDQNGLAFHTGKELDIVLDDMLNSQEHKEYEPIYKAVKGLENNIRNNKF